MEFIKTVDSDGILRIEDENEAAITVKHDGVKARVLSIFVPKGDRHEGAGTDLLNVAEQELIGYGVKTLYADFNDSISGLNELFGGAGYRIKKTAPIIAVNMKGLLSSITVQKALNNNLEDVVFKSFSELSVEQFDGILDFLGRCGVHLTNTDMARFSQEMSGVTYNQNEEPQSFVLCTEEDECIVVELLASQAKSDPKFVIGTMQGMLKNIVKNGGTDKYEKLLMVAANPAVTGLMDKVLKKDSENEVFAHVMYAEKNLVRDLDIEYDLEEEIDEDMVEEWRRETKKAPMQSNIYFKMSWMRSEIQENEKNSGPGANIKFDKNEDIRDGLTMEDTVRITADNMSDFEDSLDGDVFEDMLRPFYRGLALCPEGEKEPTAIVVWELKNVEGEEDTESELIYFNTTSTEDGAALLQEYTNELEPESVTRSFFEVEEVKEKNGQVLSDAGFEITGGESQDMIVTMGDFLDHPIAQKKPLSHVVKLSELTEKQFKRGVMTCLVHNAKGLMEDLAFLTRDWFDTEVSCAVLDDDRVTGLLLCHKKSSGRVLIDMLYSVGAEYKIDIVSMIRFAVSNAGARYDRSTEVILRRHNKQVREIVNNLFPDKKGSDAVMGERNEADLRK